MKRRIFISIFSVFLLVGSIYAQENKVKKANEEFDSYDYIDARKIYLSVVKDGYESAQVFEKLGDTYYFNSEYTEANKWYEKLVNNYPNQVKPEYYFRSAQTLKSVGQYEKSKAMMEKFKASSPSNLANNQLSNWQSFEDLTNSQNEKFKVTNITSEMSGSDFGPSFYGDKIVFASSSINTEGSKVHDWNGLPYLDLFEAEIGEDGNLSNVKSLKGDINSPYHESSAVFTKDGQTVYFTRNNYIDGKKKRGKKRLVSLKIYKATKNDDGTWNNVQELPFNDDSYSVAHPALNQEETRLYFSSNMEGTIGLSDIWYVDIHKNGSYGTPINMGSEINTEERETFPFISDNNTLFFSSDGHVGLGGLDIFKVSDNDLDHKEIINLGLPINSNQDDFGFIVKEQEKIGYLSSNRDGNNGSSSDDIYLITENCNLVIYGAITDSNTGNPLDGSLVYLIDENNEVISQQVTNANGNYEFEKNINCENQYIVRASNDEKEYEPQEQLVMTPEGSMMLQVDLALTPPDCPVNDLGCRLDLQPIYFDFDKHNIRPDAEVELAKILQAMKQYPQLNIHIESHTDSRGNDEYNMQLSERRAKSTLEWLVDKGIDRKRLSSKGYGESQLINNCSNGVNCSEEAHQLNRRSMFIIK
ncbi:flagellar motor protein MotB [Flagellimonas lutimaris]|uniref:Flagellar motor protein MotB n=1 Tax=Flagellimonas lutimaris TaxID=475082 RepID=A0A3A1N3C0_9FLAO|nr:OmpA family protein [Allomuricauda lutimaris]RIV30645.1 flagellar motor protein MotB [Allomuricauda lutimaris]